MTDIHSGFRSTDAADDAEARALFDFLTAARRLPSVRAYQRQMRRLCAPVAGRRILDIGCGIGLTALELARLANRTGHVVGVDQNESFIAEAERRAAAQSLSVEFRVEDARQLTFEAHTFDVCRTERVLMYIDQPQRVVDEMLRVVRPDGTLVFFEFDYDGVIVDARGRAFTRRVARLVANSVPSPSIGRQLPRILRARDVRDVSITAHMILTPFAMFERVAGPVVARAVRDGALPARAADIWWRVLRRRDAAERFFAGFQGFVVSGRAP